MFSFIYLFIYFIGGGGGHVCVNINALNLSPPKAELLFNEMQIFSFSVSQIVPIDALQSHQPWPEEKPPTKPNAFYNKVISASHGQLGRYDFFI